MSARRTRLQIGNSQLISLLLVAAALSSCSGEQSSVFQGYAEGEYVRIAAPFAGSLTALNAVRGAQVKGGDALFALEQENEVAARLEAAQRLKRAEAQLENLKKGKRPSELAAIEAQLAQAQASAKLSAANLRRQEQLVASNFISKERLDEARSALERDSARVTELKAALATAGLAARRDEIAAAVAEAEAARATLTQAEWKLAQKSVKAPVDSLVSDTIYVQGEWVPAGFPVVTLLPPQNIKLRFYLPEAQLGTIKLGQKVSISCDGCKAPIQAAISFISPQAEYTPPIIYSKDSRAKLVFLIEARPAPADAVLLHPGQPVDVTLLP